VVTLGQLGKSAFDVWSLFKLRLIDCRYIYGIIKIGYFKVDPVLHYCPLRKKYDPELDDFFKSYRERNEVLNKIDEMVCKGVEDLSAEREVTVSLRKLICGSLRIGSMISIR
jgi:exosome complex RNA-binding protein Rrp4